MAILSRNRPGVLGLLLGLACVSALGASSPALAAGTFLDAVLASVAGKTVTATDVAIGRALSLFGLRPSETPIGRGEVEQVVNDHEAVAESAAIGVPSELTEEEVLIVVVLKEGGELLPAALLDHCQDRLPRFAVPRYVRLVRASALSERNKEYVIAARVAGVGGLRLMFATVLPNCLAPLIVQAALGVSDAILEAAALGFLGLGAQPPTPEWGAMVGDGREFIRSNPWIVTVPGLAILVTVISINLLGDGLRDALDPKLRRS